MSAPLRAVEWEIEPGWGEAGDPRYQFRDDVEIEAQPDPDWQLEPYITAGGFAALVGPSGGWKTFLALDWSFSIATGRPWRGSAVRSGPVVYVAAEGHGSLKHRIAAWKYVNSLEGRPAGVHFLTEPLPVLDLAAVATFCKEVEQRLGCPLQLAVLDTLARTMAPGDENSTQDMGRFIGGVDLIRGQTSAAVLAVHHMGWNETRERGNSSLRGAVDSMFTLKVEDGVGSLEVVKQRDAAPADKLQLGLHPVLQSCVLVGANGPIVGPDRLTANQRKILDTIRDTDEGSGSPASRLERASGIPPGSFFRALKRCVTAGYAARNGHGSYRLTDEGTNALVSVSPRYR